MSDQDPKTTTSDEPIDTDQTPFERIIPLEEFAEEEKLFKSLNKERIRTMQIKRKREAQIMADPRIKPEDRKQMLDKWNTFDFHWRFLDLLSRLTEAMERFEHRDDVERTKGRVYGMRIVIPGTGAVTSLDLVYGTGNLNVPSGTIIDIPFIPIAKLTIFNEGPGLLFWQVFNDKDYNPNKAAVPFPPNMVVPYIVGGDLSEALISWINMRNNDTLGCTVSLIMEL